MEECNRCGFEVEIERDASVDYPFYCPECDENMYSFEVTNTDGAGEDIDNE